MKVEDEADDVVVNATPDTTDRALSPLHQQHSPGPTALRSVHG